MYLITKQHGHLGYFALRLPSKNKELGSAFCDPFGMPRTVLPVVQVRLQLTALHLLLALWTVGAHHHQLVQQVPDQ